MTKGRMGLSDACGPDHSLSAWLDAAAAKQPTPGGGSAAALVGALAAAMGEMTLNYSTGRKGNSPEQERLLAAGLTELSSARMLLLALMEEDQRAYAELTAAKRLDDADSAKARRVEEATLGAIRVPEAIMATGLVILRCAERLAEHANRWLLSDLAVCGELALATVRCGAYNVRANLADLAPDDRRRLEGEARAILATGVELVRSLMSRIDARTA